MKHTVSDVLPATNFMLIRTTCLLIAILICSVATAAPEGQALKQGLDSIDLPSANVGVANAKQGSPSASSFYEVFSGFRLTTIEGCLITLRNEGRNRRGKYIYEVVIPLADLSEETQVSQTFASRPPGAPDEYYPWQMTFDAKGGRRSAA